MRLVLGVTVLYTHSDFDGIACAALITSVEPVTEIRFAEPSDLQKGRVRVLSGSIISDLPYHSNCGKWFDHHESSSPPKKFEGSFDAGAKSCARVVLDYYDNPFLKQKFSALVDAADKIDAAEYSEQDVRTPSGYCLLSLTLDVSESSSDSRAYRLLLIELLKRLPLEKILSMPKVRSKADSVFERLAKFEEVLPQYARLEGRVAVVDLRTAPEWARRAGGRFLVYLLYPKCVASIRIRKSKAGNYDIGLGQNIFSRKLKTNLGRLASEFGGGGHDKAAGCQLKEEELESALQSMVARINYENK